MAAADALAARKWEFDSLVSRIEYSNRCGRHDASVTLLQVAQAAEASRRAEATEKKVAVLTAGFMKRATSLATQVTPPPPPSCAVAPRVLNSICPQQANGLADAAYDKSLLLETYTLVCPSFPIHSSAFLQAHPCPCSCVRRSSKCCPCACRSFKSAWPPYKPRSPSIKRAIRSLLVLWQRSERQRGFYRILSALEGALHLKRCIRIHDYTRNRTRELRASERS